MAQRAPARDRIWPFAAPRHREHARATTHTHSHNDTTSTGRRAQPVSEMGLA